MQLRRERSPALPAPPDLTPAERGVIAAPHTTERDVLAALCRPGGVTLNEIARGSGQLARNREGHISALFRKFSIEPRPGASKRSRRQLCDEARRMGRASAG